MSAHQRGSGTQEFYWLKDLKKKPEMLKPPEILIPRLMWRGARVCLFGTDILRLFRRRRVCDRGRRRQRRGKKTNKRGSSIIKFLV